MHCMILIYMTFWGNQNYEDSILMSGFQGLEAGKER